MVSTVLQVLLAAVFFILETVFIFSQNSNLVSVIGDFNSVPLAILLAILATVSTLIGGFVIDFGNSVSLTVKGKLIAGTPFWGAASVKVVGNTG